MKIYVVMGSCGEYSDRTEWVVCAYTKEEDAKSYVAKSEEYAKQWQAFTRTDEYDELPWKEKEVRENAANPLDPRFETDYTGTRYFYWEVELKEEFKVEVN